MLIGLCGKSGSGKSTLAKEIAAVRPDAVHYEIDKIGHQAMEIKEVQAEAVKCFGQQIITDGQIDRKKLAEIVFASRVEMEKLSAVTWEHMKAAIDEIIQNNEDKVLILDWILLSETPYFDMCDIKILLNAPYEVRKRRASERDNITDEEFSLREQASTEYDTDKFDMVVNAADIKEIRKLAERL